MFIHGFQEEVGNLWQETLRHPFVRSLADGTLEKEAFYYYLLQDDYYLSHFEKVIEKSVEQAGTAELATEMREVQVRFPAVGIVDARTVLSAGWTNGARFFRAKTGADCL